MVFAFISLGCEQQKEEQTPIIEPKCISNQSACVIKLVSGEFSILFNRDPIITETGFDIFLISKSKHVIKNISAHMEGKNMYMGKIPLFFEPSSNHKNQEFNGFKVNDEEVELTDPHLILRNKSYIANTMLGSCSEENMRWVIYLTLSLVTIQGEEVIERFSVEFNSIRR
jgi:hypothetical protein